MSKLEGSLHFSYTTYATSSSAISSISKKLVEITSRCDDTENKLRRCNLLFFGIEDDENEDWNASEQKVIKFCSEKLQKNTSAAQFERVHRLGRFTVGKYRPIIAKFAFFKDKQSVLASAHKLKGSTFSVREDFSLPTLQARRKLIEFAKSENKPYKLVFDRLRMGDKTYIYDSATHAVKLSAR